MADFTKLEVKHLCGSSRDVADRARTTIGMGKGDKEIKDSYMNKMYKCEHSPIRQQMYLVEIEGIPTFIATHLTRHRITPFISTMRDDRVELEEIPNRETPVKCDLLLNAQDFINISRKRLCYCSHPRTVALWRAVIDELAKVNPVLAENCVKECTYRNGFCPEHRTCGYYKTKASQDEVKKYVNVNL